MGTTTMNVAILVLLTVLFSHAIGAIGKSYIAESLWEVYLKLSRSTSHQQLRQKKQRALEVYEKRSNISSKDEFAAWAKLDREYNGLKTQIEKLNGALVSEKSRFSTVIKAGLFMATTGVKLFLRVWYRKTAVIWLDERVVVSALPSWVLWLVSMSAPRGSLSVSSWLFIVDSAVTAFQALATQVYMFCKFSGAQQRSEKLAHKTK